MKALTIPKSKIKVLQKEINNSENTRFTNRLHGVLLVAKEMTGPKAASILGKSRTVLFKWTRRFLKEGVNGLMDKPKSGKKPKLTNKQLNKIKSVLNAPPDKVGLDRCMWDGKTLSEYIHKEFSIELGVRQCQRLFHKLGFRLRKPRPMIAHADETKRQEFKKNIRLVS